MNKKICFLFFSLIIIVIGIIIGTFILTKKENTIFITDYEFLYDKAIDYIVKQSKLKSHDKDKEDYQVFTDYEGFGIEEKDNKKIAYMWILEESYYVENNELQISEGSSMAYKFIFENNEVVDYETPEDGSYYTSSIKKMFPDNIENKVMSFGMDDTKLKEKVKEHYSYLDFIEKKDKFGKHKANSTTTKVGGLIAYNIKSDLINEIPEEYFLTLDSNMTYENLILEIGEPSGTVGSGLVRDYWRIDEDKYAVCLPSANNLHFEIWEGNN